MSSTDPLLTTLCSICHIQPPKYRCPRCAIRTCSLTCTRRHKAWSSCSGIRDATAYVPPSKLKTPAGVDHDFNFLSSIERAVQRSEKEIVEERQLLAAEDLRPVEIRSVQWRRGKDGKKRRVLVTEVQRQHAAAVRPELSKQMKKRLSTFGIHIQRVPFGMTRQKENGTTVAKASGRINWQVEWILVEEDKKAENEPNNDAEDESSRLVGARTTRILGKSFDHLPLYTAFSNNHDARLQVLRPEDEEQEDGEEPRRQIQSKRRTQVLPIPEGQDPATATWPLSDYSLQPYPTPSWKRYAGVAAFTGLTHAELAQQTAHHYFLSPNPHSKTPDGKTLVHPLDSSTSLGEALRDTTVLEFPTFFVVASPALLSQDVFSVMPKKPSFRPSLASKRKRQEYSGRAGRGGLAGASRKQPIHELEEGELPNVDEDGGQHERFGGLNSMGDDFSPFSGYEVVAEESLGEEGEEGEDDTSSSGSDSESDGNPGGSRVEASLDEKLALLGRKR